MITIYSKDNVEYLPYEIVRRERKDGAEWQFLIDLIYWPRFDISKPCMAVLGIIIFIVVMFI